MPTDAAGARPAVDSSVAIETCLAILYGNASGAVTSELNGKILHATTSMGAAAISHGNTK